MKSSICKKRKEKGGWRVYRYRLTGQGSTQSKVEKNRVGFNQGV